MLYFIAQRLENFDPRTKPAPLSVLFVFFNIKFYWNTARLCIISGYFGATMAEWNSFKV